MKLINEFKTFINKGSAIDMAVGIIVGSVMTSVVNSLVKDIIMLAVSIFLNGLSCWLVAKQAFITILWKQRRPLGQLH